MPQRYDNAEGDPNLGDESARDFEILSNHIRRWWGDVLEVFHEIVSDYVHIDLHICSGAARSTVPRNHHDLSDRPMTDSKGQDHYCELLMALPPEWPIRKEDFSDE